MPTLRVIGQVFRDEDRQGLIFSLKLSFSLLTLLLPMLFICLYPCLLTGSPSWYSATFVGTLLPPTESMSRKASYQNVNCAIHFACICASWCVGKVQTKQGPTHKNNAL